MISCGMNRRISALALAFLCSTAWGAEPNDPAVRLVFEISPTSLGPVSPEAFMSHAHAPRSKGVVYQPAYAAGIPWEGPTRFLPVVGTTGAGGFIQFAIGYEAFSAAQREFLQATEGLLDSHREGGPVPQWYPAESEAGNPRQLLLYAMTLEDARRMAQAYYQYGMNRFQRQMDTLDKLIGEMTGKIAAGEKRVSEIDKLVEAAQKSLEELAKTVPYRTKDEAQEAIGELDRMLNAAQVEISGIRARMTAIQGYQQEKRGGVPAVLSRLDMMFVEESIALQGAEARRQMATHLREQANRYIDLRSTLSNADGEKDILIENLRGYRSNLTVAMEQRKSAREDEPKIPQKVVIYPVTWVENTPGH